VLLSPHLPATVLALFTGHSTEPTAYAVVFIVLAIGLRFMQFRRRGARRRGPWGGGGGPGGPGNTGGGGTPDDQPVQWDIRKPTPEPSHEDTPPPVQQADGAVGQEHNPPSDL
jgi:hypothetical protein